MIINIIDSSFNTIAQCQRNTCNFYCLLNAWSEDANAQGLSVPSFEEPSSDLSKLQQVQQISRDASSAERIWTREAATTSELLDSLQPPPRTGILYTQKKILHAVCIYSIMYIIQVYV